MKSRSILQLIAAGFTLVSVPLIAVVVTTVVQVDRLAKRNRIAVLDAEMASQQSRALTEQVTSMERSLTQSYVLGETSFYATYLSHRDKFLIAAKQLRSMRLGPELQRDLVDLIVNEQELYKRWGVKAEKTGEATPQLNTAFASLGEKSNNILVQGRTLVQFEANNAIEAASRLQQLLLYQAAAVIPITIIVAILFAYLITRSIKQIDHAIRDLGAGKFTKTIQINGPHDLEELGIRLNWLRVRISELENQKINFLRHISHELKTPLTAIRQATELLKEEQHRSTEDVEIIEIIYESSLQLQSLIEDLLQFGRTESMLKPLTKEPVQFTTLVEDVIAEYSLVMSSRQIRISKHLDKVKLYGDKERLRVILDNLISNAVRYSPSQGHIQVKLARHQDRVVLDVENTGSEIDHEDRERVFEPFFRGKSAEAGPVKGTGLGLAIVKEHVEAHHGKIQVLDRNSGAHLRVYLPMRNR